MVKQSGRPKGARFKVKTTLLLDEDTHTILKDLAAKQGTFLTTLIREALDEFLTKKTGGK